ncbi:MAG: hypothetical protein KJO21_02800 [Verrucomicrobiae bacterium]|nr:hypothetical protein [Verrucomicrobiae bacterium]NNJ41846.1 hypothetical protein [Akkermansiaceae bacterium]
MNTKYHRLLLLICLLTQNTSAIMQRGEYPWNVNLRSYYDLEMQETLKITPWLLNLGPTGIRARIDSDKADQLSVKFVFQDKQSPAKGLIQIGDIIIGANGQKFKTSHRFGRNLRGGGGWDGPMMELAGHIEESQGNDGKLNLIVWPRGVKSDEKVVPIQLRPVGRFADTFPYNCTRSEKMLEELCDFIVMDYKADHWKKPNTFHGGPHNKAHQMLALMASGIPKYDRIVKDNIKNYYNLRYNPAGGGFQTWRWGFEGIVMGEYYLLHKDRKLLPAIESLTAAMPLGSRNGNGIYTHRSELNLRTIGKKPYAAIAAISGLQMTAMSLFDKAGLEYDQNLYQNIHQHYLNSATPETAQIAYAFNSADRFNDPKITHRHAVIKLKDPSNVPRDKSPGTILPNGMQGIGEYEIFWPTQADPRWKPTNWIAKEADTNIVTVLKDKGVLRVDRNHPKYKQAPEPKKPYKTTKSGSHLAPVGMGALAHLIGSDIKPSWQYLGHHAANTCALAPGNAFDGHAGANLHGFWSILGAARSDQPKLRRAYFDYLKTFLILSETHNGGLILQPWGRDRPNCNSDCSYGPRTLTTATGAILLALGKKHLQITGADTGSADTSTRPKPGSVRLQRKARTLPDARKALLEKGLLRALAELSHSKKLEPDPINLSRANTKVRLINVEGDTQLTFQAMNGEQVASFAFSDLSTKDHALLALLVAKHRPNNSEALVSAGIYCELMGDTQKSDVYYDKAGPELNATINQLFK